MSRCGVLGGTVPFPTSLFFSHPNRNYVFQRRYVRFDGKNLMYFSSEKVRRGGMRAGCLHTRELPYPLCLPSSFCKEPALLYHGQGGAAVARGALNTASRWGSKGPSAKREQARGVPLAREPWGRLQTGNFWVPATDPSLPESSAPAGVSQALLRGSTQPSTWGTWGGRAARSFSRCGRWHCGLGACNPCLSHVLLSFFGVLLGVQVAAMPGGTGTAAPVPRHRGWPHISRTQAETGPMHGPGAATIAGACRHPCHIPLPYGYGSSVPGKAGAGVAGFGGAPPEGQRGVTLPGACSRSPTPRG